MTSRGNEAVLRGRAGRAVSGAATHPAVGHLSVGQRLLFVFALFTFGIASTYASAAMLTRVWPALFPGHQLADVYIPGVSDVIDHVTPVLPAVVKPSQPGENSSFNKRINLLVIGVDKRPDQRDEDAYNTDTLMILTIDPLSKRSAALSIPRDMWVDIHPPEGGSYKGRINSSYAAGYLRGKSFEAGADQLKRDIKMDFGIDIDNWVWLDFKGVEKLIDELGGVDVDIPSDLRVPNYDGKWYYSDDDKNAKYIAFPPGQQHLDGYNAVAFGRYRDDSDLYRVKRQQLVLQTALAKGLSLNFLDVFKMYSLYDAYSQTVHTDLAKTEMAGYAPLIKETNGRMDLYSLGDPVNGRDTLFGFTTEDGAAVLKYDPQNVQAIINQAFTPAKYSASVVEIQNATGDPEAAQAKALGRYLTIRKTLPTVELGLDVARQDTTTITLYTENRRPMAEDIARWLGIPSTAIRVETKAGEGFPDIAIVVGREFKLPSN